jgi:hypothetical protein
VARHLIGGGEPPPLAWRWLKSTQTGRLKPPMAIGGGLASLKAQTKKKKKKSLAFGGDRTRWSSHPQCPKKKKKKKKLPSGGCWTTPKGCGVAEATPGQQGGLATSYRVAGHP